MSGVIFFALPQARLITTYEIIPMAIPSEILYIKGMHKIHKYAGIASVISLKSISKIEEIIKNPTKINAGAVAKAGMAQNIGAKKMDSKNKHPLTTEANPVLAPAATPAEDSTNVVVVEVPNTAPAVVATASATSACLTLGSFPSLSSIPAFVATPIKVPKVSNMSTNKNADKIATKFSMPIWEKSA